MDFKFIAPDVPPEKWNLVLREEHLEKLASFIKCIPDLVPVMKVREEDIVKIKLIIRDKPTKQR